MLEGQNKLIQMGMTRMVKQGKKRVNGLIGLLENDGMWLKLKNSLSTLKKRKDYRFSLLQDCF